MEDEEFQRQVIEGSPHEYAAEMAGLVGDNKMSAKDKGKKLNYTVLFGGGDEKVATDLGLSIVEAKRVRKTFFRNLPALDRLHKQLKRQWKAKGYLEGIDGRAIWVRAEHMLLVYLMQGLESVVIKNFMIELGRRTSFMNFDEYELVTTSHDETQYLVRNDSVNMFKLCANVAIADVNAKFNLTCPQAIDINIGTTWAECH
jgi:DNA polymerase I-like protein with 3'-5' exonuclease and polymerase domains